MQLIKFCKWNSLDVDGLLLVFESKLEHLQLGSAKTLKIDLVPLCLQLYPQYPESLYIDVWEFAQRGRDRQIID